MVSCNMENIKILIVEDEFIIGRNLKLMLEDLGYEPFDPIDSTKDAIHLLESHDVDMAILDINLNGKHEGIEIGQYIHDNVHIPFIFLTSNADKSTIDQAKLTHPNAYLIKPFTSEDIYAAIETALNSSNNISNKEDEKLNILSDSFFIKLDRKYYKVDIQDISHFEADGKMMKIYTSKGREFLIRCSLESLFNQLKQYNFVRIHRGFCINPFHLAEINSEYVMVNNHQLPLGRNYRDDLLSRIKTLS